MQSFNTFGGMHLKSYLELSYFWSTWYRDSLIKLTIHVILRQALQADIDGFRDNLTHLSKLSDPLIKHMDNATIIRITSRETALSQRHLHTQQTLSKHARMLQSERTRHSRFEAAYEVINDFLTDAQGILGDEDPNRSADEDQIRGKIEQLKAVTTEFGHQQKRLDDLNDIGYRLALKEAETKRLKALNRCWHSLLADSTERYKIMQSHLLLQQGFNDKCEEWMVFLARVEKDLAADLVGNHEALLAQQKAFEVSLP